MHQQIPDEAFEIAQPNQNVTQRIYHFNRIKVEFPYEAYQSQQSLMKTILESVSQSQNCLLESDTGSGKTVALLCALLALQQSLENVRRREEQAGVPLEDRTPVPKIIYATKTYAHLKQVIGQLGLTEYANVNMTILASTSKVCDNVGRSQQQQRQGEHHQRPPRTFCEEVEHYCVYNPETLMWSQNLKDRRDNNNTWNLEDVKSFCQTMGTCPSHELRNVKIQDAQIVFCTYNYLIHSGIRQALQLEVANNVLVFDEGHNIEDLSREMASSPPGLFRLDNIKFVFNYLSDKFVRLEEIPDVKIGPMVDFRLLFQGLQTFLTNRGHNAHQFKEVALSFDELMEDFRNVGLHSTSISQLWENYYILEDNSVAVPYDPEVARYKLDRPVTKMISSLLYLLSHMWEGQPAEYLNKGKYDIKILLNVENLDLTELQIHCLDPSVGFRHLNTARSIIVASATLTPMDVFAAELGVPFQQRYSQPANLSVVSPERVFSARIGEYGRGCELKFNAEGLEQNCNQVALGDIIIRIASVTPYGMLVFLPSKSASRKLQSAWEVSGHLRQLRALTPAVFFEHQYQGNGILEMLDRYRAAAESRSGAILFAYFRGHLSEGVDFRDNQCRGLITVGIPFAPVDSVEAKRQYQNMRFARGETTLNGWDWYRTNAVRALNQGIGRVIRHAGDYGAIINVDSRYFNIEGNEYESSLPRLVQATMRNARADDIETVPLPLNDLIQSLKSFFAQMQM